MTLLVAGMLLGLAPVSDCVPAKWREPDVRGLELLRGAPVNCLLVEESGWRREFVEAAHERGIRVLGVVSAGDVRKSEEAAKAGIDGVVSEGSASEELREWARRAAKPLVEIVPRARLRLDAGAPVIATHEGLWAGVRAESDDGAHARPTSGPWIDTNSGFLRFVRAVAPRGTAIWMAQPAPQAPQPASRYAQAVADAAICGARWVLDFDEDFRRRLRAGEIKAEADWKRIMGVVSFYERYGRLRELPDASGLALVMDPSAGAMVSGGIVDMIAAKHIPLRLMQPAVLGGDGTDEVRMLLTIDPASLSEQQKLAARALARRGATLVNGPPGWKLTLPPPGRITYSDAQIRQLDEIWREVNGLIGRRNFAVRIFGAPGMLSNLKQDAGGGRLVLHLVNYTDYPVENITLHFDTKLRGARLLTGRGEQTLETYDAEEGTGIDVARVEDVAIVIADRVDQPKR